MSVTTDPAGLPEDPELGRPECTAPDDDPPVPGVGHEWARAEQVLPGPYRTRATSADQPKP